MIVLHVLVPSFVCFGRSELEKSMRVKMDQIIVPIVCQWYMKEFEYDLQGNHISPACAAVRVMCHRSWGT